MLLELSQLLFVLHPALPVSHAVFQRGHILALTAAKIVPVRHVQIVKPALAHRVLLVYQAFITSQLAANFFFVRMSFLEAIGPWCVVPKVE